MDINSAHWKFFRNPTIPSSRAMSYGSTASNNKLLYALALTGKTEIGHNNLDCTRRRSLARSLTIADAQ